jgi:hypothetical protein
MEGSWKRQGSGWITSGLNRFRLGTSSTFSGYLYYLGNSKSSFSYWFCSKR